ncbi:MAG TPA: HNH endonuclease signature motif containing protein [Jiangellaceae bacterium]
MTCTVERCDRPARGAWCSAHRKRWERYGDVKADVPLRPYRDVEASFWRKVNWRRADGCWEWTGSRDRKGYGYIGVSGKSRRAHRVAYELYVSRIPNDLTIDHLCRNTWCVNPLHMEPVSNAENNRRGAAARSQS